MGWREWFLSGTKSNRSTVSVRPEPSGGFTIIDVETTGLSPKIDRVLELAIVRLSRDGEPIDEWVSRFNPEGPAGATHIHGITDADVRSAPLFREMAPKLVPYFNQAPLVAHNARFDLAFLRAEFHRAGWDVPRLPAYCTLDGSQRFLPHLERRRLIDCCTSIGIRVEDAHSALGDARAAAALLRHYLSHPNRFTLEPDLDAVHAEAVAIAWPAGPTSRPVTSGPAVRKKQASQYRSAPKRSRPALTEQLTKLNVLEVLDEGAPAEASTYVEKLLEILEDGVISREESAALDDLVEVYELDIEITEKAHRAFLLALAHRAVDDGHVSREERAELVKISTALGQPDALVSTVITEADNARVARLGAELRSLPADWTLGSPLRVGDKVVFTGGDPEKREGQEERAKQLGVRVMNSVSRLTTMLVTDGDFSGTKLARAHELDTRIVSPGDFDTLLDHLQPA